MVSSTFLSRLRSRDHASQLTSFSASGTSLLCRLKCLVTRGPSSACSVKYCRSVTGSTKVSFVNSLKRKLNRTTRLSTRFLLMASFASRRCSFTSMSLKIPSTLSSSLLRRRSLQMDTTERDGHLTRGVTKINEGKIRMIGR